MIKLTYEGYIQESGAIVLSTTNDPSHTKFTYLGNSVNCASGDKYQVFECMQNVPAIDLITILNTFNSTLHGRNSFKFNPQADNETSFGNYSERGLLGRVFAVVRIISDICCHILDVWPHVQNGIFCAKGRNWTPPKPGSVLRPELVTSPEQAVTG